MADLDISSENLSERTAAVRVGGQVDTGTFALLEEEFNRLLEAGITGAAVDASGLEAISSAGIGALINLSRLLEARNGRLVVTASPAVTGTLEMLGLREILTLTDTAEQAKKLLGTPKAQQA